MWRAPDGLLCGEPLWKDAFKVDFGRRFDLLHITNVFPDLEPISFTFSETRRASPNYSSNGYHSQQRFNAYINNNDLVISYSSPMFAGADCIDGNCAWLEQWLHRVEPRKKLFFKPKESHAAVVTCGGLCPGLNDVMLCPGLNDVIRQIVLTFKMYKVEEIDGIRYGFRGFSKEMDVIKNLLEKTNATDAGGNIVLGDNGVHLQQEIKRYFKGIGSPADVKYIDPTYMIRACRVNASDSILCAFLAQNYVHGAFARFSGITVGVCNTHYVYLPIPEVITCPKLVDSNSRRWHRCLASTGQQILFNHLYRLVA